MVRQPLAALVLLTTTAALSAEPAAPPQAQVDAARAMLARLPVPKADREPARAELRSQQLDAFAVEIARVSLDRPNPRQHAAFLATIGGAETNFDTQLVLGICKPWQCDHGKAKGGFQNWRVSFTRELWAVADGNIPAQVAMADRTLRRSMKRCAPFAPFPAHVFRAYKGGAASSCSFPLKDEASRVATFNRLMGMKAGGAS